MRFGYTPDNRDDTSKVSFSWHADGSTRAPTPKSMSHETWRRSVARLPGCRRGLRGSPSSGKGPLPLSFSSTARRFKNWATVDSEFGGRPSVAVFLLHRVAFPRGPSCLLVIAAVTRVVSAFVELSVVHARRH